MKITLTILLISTLSFAFGSEVMDRIGSHARIISKTEDARLKHNESVFTFQLSEYNRHSFEKDIVIVYSINEEEHIVILDSNYQFEVQLKPGQYDFQFLLDLRHYEIQFGDVDIQSKERVLVDLYFEQSIQNIQVRKPVIYLYPQKELEVDVRVEMQGKKFFMYPRYEDGWHCTAHPNGDLEIEGNSYNYLFWETEMNYQPTPFTEGFSVKGDQSIAFLERQLTAVGLTSEEQADFITYWGPLLSKNAYNLIRFKFNDDCNSFAHLDITPRPDNIYRIYIEYIPTTTYEEIEPQKLERFNRTGFAVLEWGGYELHNN